MLLKQSQIDKYHETVAVAYISDVSRNIRERRIIYPDQNCFNPTDNHGKVLISASNEDIVSIELHDDVTNVNLQNNRLKTFEAGPKLQSLNVFSNFIEGSFDLPVVAYDYDISNNVINKIVFPTKKQLESVNRKLMAINKLYVNDNNIKSLIIPKHVHINTLFCYKNPLEELIIEGRVGSLQCYETKIDKLQINEGMINLICHKTNLKEISVPKTLKQLYCDNVHILNLHNDCITYIVAEEEL